MPDTVRPGAAGPPLLVLCYHAVTTDPGSHIAPFTVTPAAFAGQLDALVASGYRCLSLSDLLDEAPRAGGQRLAAITVDDGYADFAEHALPALVARSLPSTLYVTTGWLEGRGQREPGPEDRMLDWSQLPELHAAGVELGAHSHRHQQMDTLGRRAALEELVLPKQLLEDVLQAPVPSFAYPHGYSGPGVRALARRAGYASAAGVREALSHAGDDRFQVARLMLRADTSPQRFQDWLDHRAPVAGRVESWPTRGWRGYRRARAVLRRRPGTDY